MSIEAGKEENDLEQQMELLERRTAQLLYMLTIDHSNISVMDCACYAFCIAKPESERDEAVLYLAWYIIKALKEEKPLKRLLDEDLCLDTWYRFTENEHIMIMAVIHHWYWNRQLFLVSCNDIQDYKQGTMSFDKLRARALLDNA